MARAVKLDCCLAAIGRYLLFFCLVAVLSMALGLRFRLMFVGVHGCLIVVSVNEGSSPGKNCSPSGLVLSPSSSNEVTSVMALMPALVHSRVIALEIPSYLDVTALRLSLRHD